MTVFQKEKILAYAKQNSLFQFKDVEQFGVHRQTLTRLVANGELLNVARGLYVHRNYEPSEYFDFACASVLSPASVVCLLSALKYHEMTSESAHEVWLAYTQGSKPPMIDSPPVRLVTFSKKLMTLGIIETKLEDVQVKITNPARTIVDCFKHRNGIGVNVAIDALRDYISRRLGTMDELWEIASVCRMANVMRPYMDAI
jgi:predicted transcriptional regulator of viral defense system